MSGMLRWDEEAAEADLDPVLDLAKAGVKTSRGLPRMQEVGRPIRAFYTKNKLLVNTEDKEE